MIKLIIFDAGDVLYKTSEKVIKKVVKKFLSSKGVKISQRKVDKEWEKVAKLGGIGKLSWRECQERWLESLGMDKRLVNEWRKIDRLEIWRKHFKKFKGVSKVLRKLKERGYKLAILSDTIQSKKEKAEILRLIGINPKLFDGIFTSHDIGYEKPHRKAFEKVLKYFRVKPKDAVFVGHAEDEIEGAKRIGLKTISFRNFRVKADYFFRKFEDLIKVIEKIESC